MQQHVAGVGGDAQGRDCKDGLCLCRGEVVERDSWWLAREDLGFSELGIEERQGWWLNCGVLQSCAPQPDVLPHALELSKK